MGKLKYKKVVVIATIFIALIGLVLVCFVPIAQAVEPTNLEIKIGGEGQATGITGYIKLIYKFASGIVAGLAAVMIVIGGVQYATAAGNPKGIASAKETIISAIIGLVIVGAGYLILGLFGTQFTNLKEPSLPEVSDPGASGDRWKDCQWMDQDPQTTYCPDTYQSTDSSNCQGSGGSGQYCCCHDANYEDPSDEYSFNYCAGNQCIQDTNDTPTGSFCYTNPDCEIPRGRCYETASEAEACANGYQQIADYFCCNL